MNNIDFNDIKKRILPYFIEIYGEEFRNIIVERINQIEPIFYNTIDGKKLEMLNIKSAKRVELTIKFLDYCGVNISNEIKDEMVKSNNTLALNKVEQAQNLLKACFNSSEYREVVWGGIDSISKQPITDEMEKQKSSNILQKLGIDVNPDNFNDWLKSTESVDTFKKIEKLQQYIRTLDEEFKELDSQFNELQTLIDKSSSIKRKIYEKYMIDFLQSINKYLSEQDQKVLDEYINSDPKKEWWFLKEQLGILKIVGNSFYDDGVIYAFSNKACEQLNNQDTSKFIKNNIIASRMKYYQCIGLYKDQLPFEKFLNTKEAINYSPKVEAVEEIIAKKEYYSKLGEQEFLSVTSSYMDNIDTINRLNLIDTPEFSINDIKNNTVCICPSLREENEKIKPVALLCFSKEGCLPNYIDTMFIHEINHAIELSLLSFEHNNPCYKCGFEFIENSKDSIRNYESFSEIINQMIAMEITSAMHRDGVYLFDNPNTSKVKGGTSYEHQIILIKEFYETFKKDIIMARVRDNLDSLFHIVGKENFDNLNDIINEYKDLPYYQMMQDVLEQQNSELTQKRDALLNKVVIINEMMNEHARKVSDYDNLKGISR